MIMRKSIEERKRSIERRLNGPIAQDFSQPMLAASNIDYELAERTRAISHGGIGLVHRLVAEIGLAEAIDRRVHVLKIHLPYHESDHVLNIAYNAICEGRCLEDIELRRNDEVFLDALGAQRIPDPTTAGDFCRRFRCAGQIDQLQDAFDDARLRVWAKQPEAFFSQATIDMDGRAKASGQDQAGDCPQAGVRCTEVEERGGGRVCLPADEVQKGVPDDRDPQKHQRGKGREAVVRRDTVLLLHHQ